MNKSELISVLSVAGHDPGSGAGIQADLRTFGWLGFYGLGAVTAITSQNTLEVRNIFPLHPAEVSSQLETLLEDFRPAAVKTGMLATAPIVEAVATILERITGPIVVDPVLASTTGAPLAEAGLAAAIAARLLPLCHVITPNLKEASALTRRPVKTLAQARTAAEALVEMGAAAACVTGGHLEGAPVDVLAGKSGTEVIEGVRRGSGELHGTGCLFSAALAGLLARDFELGEAVRAAKSMVERAATGAVLPGRGLKIPWLQDPVEPGTGNL